MRERQTRPLGVRIATFPGFRKAWELKRLPYRGKTSGPVESGPTAPVPVATALRLRHDVAEHVLLHFYKVLARALGSDYALASSSGFPLHYAAEVFKGAPAPGVPVVPTPLHNGYFKNVQFPQ